MIFCNYGKTDSICGHPVYLAVMHLTDYDDYLKKLGKILDGDYFFLGLMETSAIVISNMKHLTDNKLFEIE